MSEQGFKKYIENRTASDIMADYDGVKKLLLKDSILAVVKAVIKKKVLPYFE